jgi:hypothetical protein
LTVVVTFAAADEALLGLPGVVLIPSVDDDAGDELGTEVFHCLHVVLSIVVDGRSAAGVHSSEPDVPRKIVGRRTVLFFVVLHYLQMTRLKNLVQVLSLV